MKLGDIYKNKENNSIIQIDSFATPMGRFCEEKPIIVFRKIESETGSCPNFNGYGTQEEIATLTMTECILYLKQMTEILWIWHLLNVKRRTNTIKQIYIVMKM